mgnify:CR=1 FL=1
MIYFGLNIFKKPLLHPNNQTQEFIYMNGEYYETFTYWDRTAFILKPVIKT